MNHVCGALSKNFEFICDDSSYGPFLLCQKYLLLLKWFTANFCLIFHLLPFLKQYMKS